MLSVQALLQHHARVHAEHIALQLQDEVWTYGELYDDVKHVAAACATAGLAPGMCAALVFENTPLSIIAFLALVARGVYTIPLDPHSSSRELDTALEDSAVDALVGAGPKLAALAQAAAGRVARVLDSVELFEQEESGSATWHTATPEALAVYHYTSGSTGKPKAVLHTQQNLINGGQIYRQTFGLTSGDRVFVPIPLYHSFAMVGGLIATLVSGAQLILADRFTPNQTLQIIKDSRATVLLAVPMIYDLLAQSPRYGADDLITLRLCLSSGGPLPEAVGRAFTQRYRQTVYQVYGSTETGIIAARWPAQQSAPPDAVGQAVAGVQLRIVDDAGEPLPAGATGSLLVRTPAMFCGYLNQPAATAAAFRDGWYDTGDQAQLDDAGYLFLIGRKNTFINVGGKKVNPTEVEQVLLAHPHVKEAVVFGEASVAGSDRVVAAVVIAGAVDTPALLDFCRSRLAPYKVPSMIRFEQELARAQLGKLRRSAYDRRSS